MRCVKTTRRGRVECGVCNVECGGLYPGTVVDLWPGFQRELLEFYVLLTVHLITIFVNNQLDAQFFFLYLFIPILYMFRATKFSS